MALASRHRQQIQDLAVVEFEVVVSHVDFERGIAFPDQLRQFLFQYGCSGVADDHVKSVVDDCLALSAPVIVFDGGAQRLPLGLCCKRNHCRGAAACCGDRAAAKIVRHLQPFFHRLIQMAVTVDATRQHQLATGVDFPFAGCQTASHRHHLAADDTDIALHDVRCGGDRAAPNDQIKFFHMPLRAYRTSRNRLPQPRIRDGSDPAWRRDFHTTVEIVS